MGSVILARPIILSPLSMIRFIYSSLFTLCMPFVLLKLFWRGYKAPEYQARRMQRFGVFKAPNIESSIWFHTVSVGELLAAEPIIRQVQAAFPGQKIVVTTMTPTSSELLDKLFGNSVFHVYAPYDLPICVRAFLKRIRPRCAIIMETELWPNTIHLTSKRGCPVVVANARLSERSARGYLRLRPAIGWMLDGLSMILCQHPNDARRFESLGIASDKISVTGSVKYDIEVAPELLEQGHALRGKLAGSQRVWVAASTHEGEDEAVLAVHRALRQQVPDLVLILVPRHPERFESAYQQALAAKFKVYKHSQHQSIPADAEVFVVDMMGAMMPCYAASDLAFVGGSLVAVGGHNPIEPAVLNKPVLMGPNYFNFEAICQQLMESEGLLVAQDQSELQAQIARLLSQPELMLAMGQRAGAVVAEGRGAVARVVERLLPLIEKT